MTLFQKVIKYVALALAICLIIGIFTCIMHLFAFIGGLNSDNAVSNGLKEYTVSQNIDSLDFDIGAANLKIINSEKFSVKSNINGLKIKENDGCLNIVIKGGFAKDLKGAELSLYVPGNYVFKSAKIQTGAGKLSVDTLSADKLDLELGAGEARFDYLNAEKEASINGGVGNVYINGGTFKNLDFDMGIGNVSLTAALTGSSDIDCGIGNAEITLTGEKDEYTIYIDKGVGNIKIDGQNVSDGDIYGDGENKIELDCGTGSTELSFNGVN